MNDIAKYKFQLASFVFIVIAFHLCYGISIVVPSNISWLMEAYHDWGTHYLGWTIYQHEPWYFPIGHIENYNYPAGTNIGFTDSIPLLAIVFKLFSFLLPDTFQYFGIWLLLCHFLAGYFTFKVLKQYTSNYVLLMLSILLVSFCPVLIYRMLHPALCAHWVLIASIYYYTKKAEASSVHIINKNQIIVLVLSALINPYLFLMVVGFNIILPFKHYFYDKLISLERAVFYILLPIILSFFSWYMIGMVSFGEKDNGMEVEHAYGLYGLNLNAFYNSSGFSSFFPQLPFYTVQQYEGYAYLGLGAIILIVISLVYLVFKLMTIKKSKALTYTWLMPLIILIVVLSLFAISNQVTFNDRLLFEFGLPDLIIKVGNIFRASGRFIWILYYVLFLFAIIYFLKIKVSNTAKIVVLLLIVSLQFYDIKLFATSKDYSYGNYKIKPLNEKKWTSMSANFERIVTYPPFENNLVYNLDYQDLCFIAAKNKLPITCGYVARNSGVENIEFRKRLDLEISNGIIAPNDLFIIAPDHLKYFNTLIYKNKVSFGFMDGYYYLYSNENSRMVQHDFSEFERNKKDSIAAELSSITNLKLIEKPDVATDKIQFNIEKNTFNNDVLIIEGWAFFKDGTTQLNDSIYIALNGTDKTYVSKTMMHERPDLSQAFKNDNLKRSGFKSTIFTDTLDNSDYKILIGIASNNTLIFESANQPLFTLDKDIPPQKLVNTPYNSETITYNIEENFEELDFIFINGWAFVNRKNSRDVKIEIVLENDGGTSYLLKTFKKTRSDVTSYFKSEYNYDHSGFSSKVKKELLKKGTYRIGVLISNDSNVKDYTVTDKIIEIKK